MLNNKSLQSVAEAVKKVWSEELKGNQHKIDKNKNNKIDAQDFKMLRKEGWDDMVKSAKDAVQNKPKPRHEANHYSPTEWVLWSSDRGWFVPF